MPLPPGIAAVTTSSIFNWPRWSSSMIAAAVNIFVVLAPRKCVAGVVPRDRAREILARWRDQDGRQAARRSGIPRLPLAVEHAADVDCARRRHVVARHQECRHPGEGQPVQQSRAPMPGGMLANVAHWCSPLFLWSIASGKYSDQQRDGFAHFGANCLRRRCRENHRCRGFRLCPSMPHSFSRLSPAHASTTPARAAISLPRSRYHPVSLTAAAASHAGRPVAAGAMPPRRDAKAFPTRRTPAVRLRR